MDVEIYYNLSAGKNAGVKYSLRNKYRQKLKGLERAIATTNEKLIDIEKNNKTVARSVVVKQITEKKWFEKFRWFFTTNGFLVIGGKDAKNNELLVKKYMTDNDLYFHADIHGAPHVIMKYQEGQDFKDVDKEECAIFAASYSSAWKSLIYSVDVYSVLPDQVSKSANSGESLGTGAFVIKGKREYFRKNELRLAIGYDNHIGLLAGPATAVKTKTKIFFEIIPGDLKKSDIANRLVSEFAKKCIVLSADELLAVLPTGDSKFV